MRILSPEYAPYVQAKKITMSTSISLEIPTSTAICKTFFLPTHLLVPFILCLALQACSHMPCPALLCLAEADSAARLLLSVARFQAVRPSSSRL